MEWISVKDRLPEVEVEVLVYEPASDCSGIDVAWLVFDVAGKPLFLYAHNATPMPSVTHWMPLPEKPKMTS